MKKEKRTVFWFSIFYGNEKRMKALKIQTKNVRHENSSQFFEFHCSY